MLDLAPLQLALLAQAKPKPLASPSEVSEHFNHGRWDLPWELVVVGIGMVLASIAAISLFRWWQRRHDDPTPLMLFSAIARKAGLSWGERILLWRIARSEELPTPIALLLARGTLTHYATRFARKQSPRTRERVLSRVNQLKGRLFGE